MRFIWVIFTGLLVAMVAVLPHLGHHAKVSVLPAADRSAPLVQAAPRHSARAALTGRADSIVAFGLAQQGTPYIYAGTSPLTGFDCSGFIMYTFAHFGVPVPHSTALLIDAGRPVARADAQPGDIVVFTGTAPTSNTPGHAGIVISRRGQVPLRFVHASSSRREPFVKVSQVEDSDYERRFMQVRRVLGPGADLVATARPKFPVPASTPAVAHLWAQQVAVTDAPPVITALPGKLAPKKLPTRTTRSIVARKKLIAKASTAKKKAATPVKRKAPNKTATKKRTTKASKRNG